MTFNDPHLHEQRDSDCNRRSIRLKGYDYTLPGAYFITLVTWHRDCLFGTVVNGKMQLSALGKIVQDEWMRSIEIRREIHLHDDEFVIMPNHLHAIAWLVCPDDMPPVGADGVRPNNGVHPIKDANLASLQEEGACHAPLRKPKSLSSFIAGYKSSVTSRAKKELNMNGIWQRNYYEHIIRNQAEWEKIHMYILDNPREWSHDQENPDRTR